MQFNEPFIFMGSYLDLNPVTRHNTSTNYNSSNLRIFEVIVLQSINEFS